MFFLCYFRSRLNSVKQTLQQQQQKMQPDSHQRKSASQQQQQQQQQQQRDFLPFKPPLMMEKAEEIIDRAMSEDQSGLLRIHRGSLYRPSGSIMYLQRNANLIGKGPDGLCEDGYNWTEIIHQVNLHL